MSFTFRYLLLFPIWYADGEAGAFSCSRLEAELAVMLVFYDVASDSHTQASAHPNGFRREEILVEALLHLVSHTLTVIADADDEMFARDGRLDIYGGLVVFALRL